MKATDTMIAANIRAPGQVAERWDGTRTTRLAEPPDAWGGRALIAWARSIASDPSFDASAEEAHAVAGILDRMLGRA